MAGQIEPLPPFEVTSATLDAVSPAWDALFDAGPGFQSSRAWFAATIEAALPPGSTPLFLLCHAQDRPVAMLPLLRSPGQPMHGLSTVYTCLFQPLLAADADDGAIRRAGVAFARHCRGWGVVVLDALDPDWPGLAPLLAGFRMGGMVSRRFDHFGNWHQPATSWPEYLASRPGQLRETIRRKGQACARDKRVRIEVLQSPDGLDRGIAAYEAVYSRSWKVPEPAPRFTAALLPCAATAGVLRLGVLWVGDQPVAAQYWTLDPTGTATVLKLAHDDAWKALSPGTVLTAHMIERLLENGATSLDFGRGDDGYKALWADCRRPRIGVLLCYPGHPAGVVALGRHFGGQLARWIQRRDISSQKCKLFRRFFVAFS